MKWTESRFTAMFICFFLYRRDNVCFLKKKLLTNLDNIMIYIVLFWDSHSNLRQFSRVTEKRKIIVTDDSVNDDSGRNIICHPYTRIRLLSM
jgi:hypothetical protein